MERIIPDAGRDVTEFNSRGARWVTLRSTESSARIGFMHFSPGALLGEHPTGMDQLFVVVHGSGWVRTGDAPPQAISENETVLWRAGEVHESGSEEGMTVLIVQSTAFSPVE